MLLSGVARVGAVVGILLVVAWLVDFYRFAVDPIRQEITIRTLWWDCHERRVVTYSFSDVQNLRKAELGDGENGYRWDFADGARYELWAPVDPRLLDLFLERG